jgi:hypothetical protein
MGSITDSNATDDFDQSQVVLRGGTDNTKIGNVGDRFKVDAAFSNSGNLPIYPADSLYQDAFGRSRVSTPKPIFNSLFTIDKEPYKWDEVLTNGGTSTRNTNKSCVDMATTTASGSKVIRQSRRSFLYITGLSKLTYQTFVFNAAKTGLRQRIGAFDESQGVFLQQAGSTISLVFRTSVSGSPADTTITQANWNGDKLNGSGASGITLDLTKAQILFIDMQWLGVGRVRVGFIINGIPVLVHSFLHSNIITSVYTTTAKWHLRAEIENTAGAESASTMQHICSSVIIEGDGIEIPGNERTANNGITTRSMSAGNRTIVNAIRVKSTFQNTSILPQDISILVTSSNDVLWELILDATINGGAWVSCSTIGEQNITATSVTGGVVLSSGYIRNGSQVASQIIRISQDIYLGHDISDIADTFCITVTPLASNGNCVASINYKELY